uniref:Uncharacterized protein n=1 Tax=Rhizophora mucronata TaxID=61149 RepID=A0A2P2PZJ3_RHIMU
MLPSKQFSNLQNPRSKSEDRGSATFCNQVPVDATKRQVHVILL